ncbi:hypothetical protein [Dactylosporangium sp. NPDC048998]|uniref:hypothetical protein n=1 Tax=Dactylosporangium sp. NPDC048998 TaxID=3363976 RepID=UPI00371A6C61
MVAQGLVMLQVGQGAALRVRLLANLVLYVLVATCSVALGVAAVLLDGSLIWRVPTAVAGFGGFAGLAVLAAAAARAWTRALVGDAVDRAALRPAVRLAFAGRGLALTSAVAAAIVVLYGLLNADLDALLGLQPTVVVGGLALAPDGIVATARLARAGPP